MSIGINKIDTSTALFDMQGSKLDSLSKLNLKAETTDEKLKKSSIDFEAVFIKQFIDVLDSTIDKGEFMHGGQGEATFKSMLNDEMAKNIASNPRTSFGLAEQIYKQMKDRI